MSGILSLMLEGVDSRLNEIQVKEETANELFQDNIDIETPGMDENIEMEMDIKEEVVGFEQTQPKSESIVGNFIQDPVPLMDPLNTEESSGTSFKRDIDESVQILLRSGNHVSTTKPLPEDQVHTETEVGSDHELPSPSKYITRYVVRQKLANPQPQVSSRRLCGQKRPYLTTLIGAKTHTCKNCSARFETKFKLREHNKWHTGEKRLRRRNRKTRFKCSVCEETFSGESILSAHLKTHTGEKPCRSLGKGSLTVEKGDPRGGPKNKYEEMDYHLHHNSTTQADSEGHQNVDLEKMSSKVYVECGSTEAEERDFNDFSHDLLLCQRNCETCVKYMSMLRKHVRATHAPPQPILDPLLIVDVRVPLAYLTDLSSSSIQIKSEDEENIEKMHCSNSEEVSAPNSDPEPDYNMESDSESDPDYAPSPSFTQESRHQDQDSVKSDTSNQSSNSKSKKKNLPSRDHFKCEECGKGFSRMIRLKEHMSVHTGEKPFKCDVCDGSFARSYRLTEHKRIHTGERPFKCDLCENSFAKKNHLTEHKKIHTGEKPFKCDLCEKCFALSCRLTEHKKTHTGKKPFKCDMCDGSFARSYRLTEHKRIHTGERPFKCDLCEKGFAKKSNLAEHKRVHTGEKSFKCGVCEKSFTLNGSLTIHMIIHTGEKPFKCDVCEKSFARKGHLTVHKRIHTGEKCFQCDICVKSFTQKSNLYSHKRIHSGERPYKCDQCEKSFTKQVCLTDHKKIHT